MEDLDGPVSLIYTAVKTRDLFETRQKVRPTLAGVCPLITTCVKWHAYT